MRQTVFPCITFNDAKASIEWLERALGAERLEIYADDEGRVVHAEVRIGESTIMCGDRRAGSKATPVGASVVYVVVPDADAAYDRAKAAGADVTDPIDQGGRTLVSWRPTREIASRASGATRAPVQADERPREQRARIAARAEAATALESPERPPVAVRVGHRDVARAVVLRSVFVRAWP